jgi:hypothetical protein
VIVTLQGSLREALPRCEDAKAKARTAQGEEARTGSSRPKAVMLWPEGVLRYDAKVRQAVSRLIVAALT